MKNKNMLLTALVLPILSLTTYVSADFDCSTVDRESMKTIMEKQRSNETLTTTEQTTLDNMKSCMPTWTGWMQMWDHIHRIGSWSNLPEMSDTERVKMDTIKTILEKKKNGETLTSDEQTTLDTFQASKPQMWSWSKFENNKDKNSRNTISWNLSNAYKTKIDSAVDKIISNISSYSDTDKLTTLNTLKTKVTTAKSNVDNSTTYSDSKKSTYNSIFDYLLEKINSEIDDLSSTDTTDTDSLLNNLFQ